MQLNSIALLNDSHIQKATFTKSFDFLDNKYYAHLREKAKKLYRLFYNRYKLSKNNDKYHDEEKNVFINYTLESIQEKLECSKQAALNYKDALIECGLVVQQRLGLNKANRYYLLEPKYEESDLYEIETAETKPAKKTTKITKKIKKAKSSAKSTTTMPFFVNEDGYKLLLGFKNYGYLTSNRQIKQAMQTLHSITSQKEKEVVQAGLLTNEGFFHMFKEYTSAKVATQEAFMQILYRIKEQLDFGGIIENFGAYLRRSVDEGLYEVMVKMIYEFKEICSE